MEPLSVPAARRMMRVMVGAARVVLCCLGVAASAVACREAPPERPTPSPVAVEVPGAVVSAPARDVVARHDLSTDEVLGGHTLERHVGRSDDQLRERLRREPNISAASTYTDRVTAERVIAHALDESAPTIDRWQERTGRRQNLVVDRVEPSPIGRSLRRGQRASSPCAHALVVLRWDLRREQSYVLTSYPECGR